MTSTKSTLAGSFFEDPDGFNWMAGIGQKIKESEKLRQQRLEAERDEFVDRHPHTD